MEDAKEMIAKLNELVEIQEDALKEADKIIEVQAKTIEVLEEMVRELERNKQ